MSKQAMNNKLYKMLILYAIFMEQLHGFLKHFILLHYTK